MKKSIVCLGLLLVCLPPCAAQNKNNPTLLHSGSHRAVIHTSVPKPKAVRPAVGGSFSDVPKDHWAAAAVETLRQRGIVVGYPASR